ncbi:ferredoxin reductase [Solirubrobacter ginsenosidimutans]|uniref:Ferredoxin reductase n=1 Tax=Solirubrobacter ginsenosidimutans TaxID=490573 RepID=A0A9X3SAI0_9ACTN|nr:ferredoxin reductase [Solirubrobacter ginsenosidimutans]
MVSETRECVTLWLRPGRGWPAHLPGQYVRVGVDVDGVRHWRTYSLTSVPGRRDGRIAITVKRIAGGLVSDYLVSHARRGMVVRLAPPTGQFVLPEVVEHALLFVTAGSGVTPIMGMLRALSQRSGGLPDVVHVHISPSLDDTIFGGDLRALECRHERYTLHEHHDDRHGRWDVAELDRCVPDWSERQTWACGPAGLLDALSTRFARAGVSDQLHLERFRPVLASVDLDREGGRVRFLASGKEVETDGTTPLLVAGEQAGALLPHGCRMGICNSCIGRLRSGAVRDLRTGDVQHAEGQMVRTCVSVAAGPIEIDL